MSRAVLKLSPLETLYAQRKKRSGPKVRPLSERFWSKVSKDGPIVREELGPCWVWKASRQPTGYGQIYAEGIGPQFAHRLSWVFANGEIPPGMLVCHRCDNPPCVNPEHLWLGTDADNAKDRDAKGRRVLGQPVSGERSHLHKLKAFEVREIRSLYASGLTPTQIAANYGVGRSAISEIVHRRCWKDLP